MILVQDFRFQEHFTLRYKWLLVFNRFIKFVFYLSLLEERKWLLVYKEHAAVH